MVDIMPETVWISPLKAARTFVLLQPLLLIYHIILKYSRVSVSLKSTKARLYSEQAVFTTKIGGGTS